MDCEREFYLCPACFRVEEESQEHHQRRMIYYAGFALGDAALKPPQDEAGNLTTRAPRWFVQQRWPHALRK